ncbi:MAG TPA: multidrug efflux protein [Myxococcales bacterium]|nr:multidrug efflux protein [Myxococcales bacterium]HIL02004.1 multidrug efflux protein [Myxococcales bacterium]
MAFTDTFIRRPVLSAAASLMLLLLGLQAAGELKVREYPKLETGIISVRTLYRGASARTVLGFVTTPLQRYLAKADGIDYLSSTTRPGSSTIELHLRLGEDTRSVLSDVIAKINEARYELPQEIEDPIVSNEAPGDALMYIAFFSDELSIPQVNDYLARSVQPILTTLEGVGEAELLGNKNFAMRVWLHPEKMVAHNVTAEDVRDALRRDNYISTSGTTEGVWVLTSVEANTALSEPSEFSQIVVRQEGDRRVILSDVAELELSGQNIEFSSFSSGRPTVFIAVKPSPGANPLAVAERVHAVIPELQRQMPADLEAFVDFDASTYINEALDGVMLTMIEAAVIVIFIIYLFLGSLRVVFIPLVAIPLSLIGGLFFMYGMGFSINLLTLLAMVIAIGLVVDDAIVVVENVHRHIEEGATPYDAALRGARQVALPVVAMTLTLVAVYAPIGFLGGLTGALFTEFALTLGGAVLVSGFVALTLSPMMCAYLLRERESQTRFSDWLDRRFHSLRESYRGALALSLANQGAVLLFSAAILLSLPILFGLSGEELAPKEDSGGITVIATAPQYANLDYIDHFLDQIVDIWKKVPEVAHSWQVSSKRFVMGGLSLVHWNDRERSQAEIMQELQPQFNRISGLEVFTFADPRLPGAESGLPVNFVIASNENYQQVDAVAEAVMQKARESGLFLFVSKTLKFTRPETIVNIDRAKAARLGISMQSIGDTLSIMLGEAEVNRFTMEGRSYKVIPQASPDFRLTEKELENFYVRTTSGNLVPLATLVSLEQKVEPNSLTQYQQLHSTNIQGMMMPPNSLGVGLEFLEKTLNEVAPVGYRAGFEGEGRRFIQERSSFAFLFALSLTVIFLVLAAQFNSFRDPLVVLIAVPMSIFGAVATLALGAATLNIYTQIGLLTLIGLISKHGILIVDFANHQVAKGMDRREAVLEAASLRLRPILMTTAATVLGVVPLLVASGAGANSRFSIGLMIAAGMLVGTLFTLFVVPTFYLLGAPQASAHPASPPDLSSEFGALSSAPPT